MADAPFIDVGYVSVDTDSARVFQDSSFKQVGLALEPLYFTVARAGAQLRIDFGREVRGIGATDEQTNYTVTGPSTITVTSVVFTPVSTFLLLNVTGTFVAGTYTLTMDPQTAQANNDDQYNITTGVTFEGLVVLISTSGFNPGFN